MPLLQLRQITLKYSSAPLLDQIDFQVEAGERICLLGRNGEGKSSLLQLITRAIAPDSGDGYCVYGFYQFEWAVEALLMQRTESPDWLLGSLFGYSPEAIDRFRCASSERGSTPYHGDRSTYRTVGIYGPLARRVQHHNT